ncbi:Cytochrome P450 4C1 [Papilio machaon]|uniref:Cytochrome P450 4C1 n=1 Tax=Papilio machaon TaxID=76193 RepID=A0A0N1IJS8_PAPMA|nr:Cytochrome P450 4C1 [Papilio machaon]
MLVERFQKFWLHSDFIYNWSNLKKKQERCLKILHNMSNTAFLDLLLELSTDKGAFNDLEIREQVDTMIAAGHETSANVLMFTLVMIGSYPKVQDRIFEELYNIFGNDDRDVTKQDLSQLVYLEAVLKETMRVYPIVPVTMRWLDRNVKLSKSYAYSSMKTTLAHLLRPYRVQADHSKMILKFDVVLKPECGHFISIEKR